MHKEFFTPHMNLKPGTIIELWDGTEEVVNFAKKDTDVMVQVMFNAKKDRAVNVIDREEIHYILTPELTGEY